MDALVVADAVRPLLLVAARGVAARLIAERHDAERAAVAAAAGAEAARQAVVSVEVDLANLERGLAPPPAAPVHVDRPEPAVVGAASVIGELERKVATREQSLAAIEAALAAEQVRLPILKARLWDAEETLRSLQEAHGSTSPRQCRGRRGVSDAGPRSGGAGGGGGSCCSGRRRRALPGAHPASSDLRPAPPRPRASGPPVPYRAGAAVAVGRTRMPHSRAGAPRDYPVRAGVPLRL